jgi:hypothetical protein
MTPQKQGQTTFLFKPNLKPNPPLATLAPPLTGGRRKVGKRGLSLILEVQELR